MSKESDEELKTGPEPSCPWNKTDPRDAGGNRDIIIFGGDYVALGRVETEDGNCHIDLYEATDAIRGLLTGEWPSNYRWIEPPKETEE